LKKSPKANYKVSTSKEGTEQTHTQRQNKVACISNNNNNNNNNDNNNNNSILIYLRDNSTAQGPITE
jgi:hypothetical protein